MRSDPPSKLLAGRISRLVDGLLDENETAELEKILRSSRTARDYYRHYLSTHLDLAEHFHQDAAARPTPIPIRPRRATVALAIAAMIPLAAGLWFWTMRNRVDPRPVPPASVAVAAVRGPVLAVTAHAAGVQWSLPESPAAGLLLRAGSVRLESGRLALDLVGGQTVTLQGPAEFKLLTETEMLLFSGDASLRMADGRATYIIRVPGGAVVDLGTEFSVKIAPDGTSDVHVFEGEANASVTGAGNSTREERPLQAGESVRIAGRLSASSVKTEDFLRPLARDVAAASPAGDAYAGEIGKSAPVAWWRFDSVTPRLEVLDEAGTCPLLLYGTPRIIGCLGRRFMQTDRGLASGFAAPENGIDGLDTKRGMTVECLLYPTSERHSSAIGMEQPGISPPSIGKFAKLRHAPSRLSIDRMARRGAVIGHVHPDFAIRAVMRSPAGYDGGVNTYSTESHLLHRWVHVVLTNDGTAIRLYIDGRLSDEAVASLPFLSASLRPIIGRVQPEPSDEHRQWVGGIDEVALYGRVLGPEEIRAHFEALER